MDLFSNVLPVVKHNIVWIYRIFWLFVLRFLVMRHSCAVFLLLAATQFADPLPGLAAIPDLGQTPASENTSAYVSQFGFQYNYPANWNVVTAAPITSAVQAQTDPDLNKRGTACSQIALLVRSPDRAVLIIAMQLPYACIGYTWTEPELATYGNGFNLGLAQTYDLGPATITTFKLGQHAMWASRFMATPKNHPDHTYYAESVCTVLKQAAICWAAIAAEQSLLSILEQGKVSLEGDPPTALVPSTAFNSPN